MNDKNFKNKLERLKNIVPPEYKETIGTTVPLHAYYIKMMQEVKNVLEGQYELTKSELDLLITLSISDISGTLSPTELYDYLVFSSGGMTKLLKKLENKEYIKRVDNIEDRRSKLVQITSNGKNIAKKAMSDVLKVEKRYLSILSESERKNLSTTLKKLVSLEK